MHFTYSHWKKIQVQHTGKRHYTQYYVALENLDNNL